MEERQLNKIIVIGSMATDFVVTTKVKPNQGETVFGEKFDTNFGGKGANQAIAASRLGAEVAMLGHVGTDRFGNEIVENLNVNGVSTENVEPVTHFPSGAAHIILHENDNSIIVIPGANNVLDFARFSEIKGNITEADLVILQNEIPQEANEAIIDWCWEAKIPVLYNPAPARKLNPRMLSKVGYLTPNEHEFKLLFPNQKLADVLAAYPNRLIVTLGAKGAIFHNGKSEVLVPAFPVAAVDTTGAGDTFNGALAVGILAGVPLENAIAFANLAAAISVKGYGAQGGMPTLKEMKESPLYEEAWGIK